MIKPKFIIDKKLNTLALTITITSLALKTAVQKIAQVILSDIPSLSPYHSSKE